MLADALRKQRVDPTIFRKVLRTGTSKNPRKSKREGTQHPRSHTYFSMSYSQYKDTSSPEDSMLPQYTGYLKP
jgi:hypothetical protein